MFEIISIAALIAVVSATIIVTNLYHLNRTEKFAQAAYKAGYEAGMKKGIEEGQNRWLDRVPDEPTYL